MEHDISAMLAPKLLMLIIDRSNTERLEALLKEKQIRFHFVFNGMGTASSEVKKAFGLSGTEKTVCACFAPQIKIKMLMLAAAERMELSSPGNGIAFIVPVSGISASISQTFSKEMEHYKERLAEWFDMESEKVKEEARFELVAAVINQGYSEKVMDVARAVGARGGTIINARHSGLEDAVKFFGVTLQEEKEIVCILAQRSQKKELMQRISKACGSGTDAQGIVISLPVEGCTGLREGTEP